MSLIEYVVKRIQNKKKHATSQSEEHLRRSQLSLRLDYQFPKRVQLRKWLPSTEIIIKWHKDDTEKKLWPSWAGSNNARKAWIGTSTKKNIHSLRSTSQVFFDFIRFVHTYKKFLCDSAFSFYPIVWKFPHFMKKYCSRQAMRMEKPANTHTISAAKRSSLEMSPAALPDSAAHTSPGDAVLLSWRRSVNREEGLRGPLSSWDVSWHRRHAPTRKR